MNAIDIKEHREERPRLYGLFWQRTKFAGMWCGKLETDPPRSSSPSCGEVTFTIPSEREQKLLEEREEAVQTMVNYGLQQSTAICRVAGHIRELDQKLAEMRGGK